MHEYMADPESAIPPANTPAEINIHLGYIRRDILAQGKAMTDGMKGLQEQISALDDHYVSEAAFAPVKDQTEENRKELVALKEWKDNFTGKMIGFAAGISAASAGGAAILVKLFGG